MLRLRILAPLAIVVGAFIGMITAADAHQTGHTLAVALTPPTLSSGSSPLLNCGWHTACGSPPTSGVALDWEDGGTNYGNPWHFRGFFYVSDGPRTAFRMYPLVNQQGSSVCDIMTVWITEKHSGALMAIPTYYHVTLTATSQFDWSGSQWTTYHSRQMGATMNDAGGSCTFFGSHVHDTHVSYLPGVVSTTTNTGYYPTASSCSWNCGTHQNNNINKWIRRWEWSEGVVSH